MIRLPVFAAIVIANSTMIGLSFSDDLTRISIESLKSAYSVSSVAGDDHPALPRAKRILMVSAPSCARCADELRRLEAPGGPFELLRNRGWKIGAGAENHIQIIDKSGPVTADIANVVVQLNHENAPVVVYVENGDIARSFRGGCTTPLDQWTFGWLMTGNDQRPAPYHPEAITVATSGNYPLRGNHWSVEGHLNPSREYIIQHLRSVHGGYLQANWNIETWSQEELLSAHDDIHERTEGFRGRHPGSGSSIVSRSSASSKAPAKVMGGYRTPGK